MRLRASVVAGVVILTALLVTGASGYPLQAQPLSAKHDQRGSHPTDLVQSIPGPTNFDVAGTLQPAPACWSDPRTNYNYRYSGTNPGQDNHNVPPPPPSGCATGSLDPNLATISYTRVPFSSTVTIFGVFTTPVTTANFTSDAGEELSVGLINRSLITTATLSYNSAAFRTLAQGAGGNAYLLLYKNGASVHSAMEDHGGGSITAPDQRDLASISNFALQFQMGLDRNGNPVAVGGRMRYSLNGSAFGAWDDESHDFVTDDTTLALAAGSLTGGQLTASFGTVSLYTQPSIVYVDDSWVGTPIGSDPDGGGPATAFGYDAFATLREGVAGVAPAGSVNLAAGSYNETSPFGIGKSLTIAGAGQANTLIRPLTDDLTCGGTINQSPPWIVTAVGTNFTLTGVTIDGSGHQVCNALRLYGTGTISQSAFVNLAYGTYYGVAIALYANAQVLSNNFSGIGRVGVLLASANVTNGQIIGNRYTGKGSGNHLDYAFEVGRGSQGLIAQNIVSGNLGIASDGSTSAAIYPESYFAPGSQATIVSNYLSGNLVGIAVGYDQNDNTQVSASFNTIVGNGTGIEVTAAATQTLDFANNWWGCNAGPGMAGCDIISGTVSTAPWLVLRSDAQPAVIPVGGTAVNTATLVYNSQGQDTSGLGHILDGTTVNFAATLGSVNPSQAGTTSGYTSTLFTAAASPGMAVISSTVDNQSVTATVQIIALTPTATASPLLTSTPTATDTPSSPIATPTSPPLSSTPTATDTPTGPTATPTSPPLSNTPSTTATPSSPSPTPPATATPGGPTPTECAISYPDVPVEYWAYGYIKYLSCQHIVSGYPDGSFRPNQSISRAEFAKISTLAYGFAIVTPASPSFNDVPATYWAYPFIETLVARGVINGYPDGSFRPAALISRAEMVKIVVIASGVPIYNGPFSDYPDVPQTHWAYSYIKTASFKQWVGGYADGFFRPNAASTRAELAKVVFLALSFPRNLLPR